MLFRVRNPVALLAAVAFAGACSRDSAAPASGNDGGPVIDAGDDAVAAATLASLVVSTGVLRPTFDPGVTDYDVTSLNSLYPVAVTATSTTPSATLTIHGAAAESGVPSSFTLHPREDFTVVAQAPGLTSSTYTVHYVPSDYPAYNVTSLPGAGTEDVLLTPDGEYLLMIDRSGAPLYYRTFLPNDLENFQQFTLPSGAVFYAATVGIFDASGWTLGVDHLMDQHFNDVADYQLLPYAAHGTLPAESHEFLLLDDQHYVIMSYVQRTLDLSSLNPNWSTQALVMSNVFQEIDHGNVLVEWDSANVPSLYSDSLYENTFGPSTVEDYLHLNSIDIDPSDGNFIVSFRHTSSIVKIDRHSAQILWTLGGAEDQYGLTPEQAFSFQHHVRMQPDGTMTVFDDGNLENPVQTRVLSFVLDQVNHKVSSFSVLYTKPSDQPPTGLMGSASPLAGGRLFCGWGGWYSTAIAPGATEIVGGAPVWSLELTTPGVFSYRALPIASP
jgi:arylsulfate sulfotransferase